MSDNLKEMVMILMMLSVSVFGLVQCSAQNRKIECQTAAFKAGVDAKVCQ